MKKIIKLAIILLLLIVSNMLYSQEMSVDTTAFYKAHQKIDSCKSGRMIFRLNYPTSEFELYWDVDLYFMKNDENVMSFYIQLYEYSDSVKSECVYYKDTLLLLDEGKNKSEHYKGYTNKPFKRSLKNVLTYLIDGRHNLSNFMSYDNVKLYDSISSVNQNNKLQVLEASRHKTDTINKVYATYTTKIILNNNDLTYCFNEVDAKHYNGDLFHKASQEYIIDSVSLYDDKKQYIEDKILLKYHELDSIITPNLKEKKVVETADTIQKEIPKYAYDWKLPLVNGDTLASKDIKSKILVLDFYYMSCGPCVLAIRDLVRLDSLYNEKDVSIVGINVHDKDTLRINKFIKNRRIEYRNVLNGKELVDEYGFKGFPSILFIDTKTNEIIFHSLGYRDDGFVYYKELLDGFLEKYK